MMNRFMNWSPKEIAMKVEGMEQYVLVEVDDDDDDDDEEEIVIVHSNDLSQQLPGLTVPIVIDDATSKFTLQNATNMVVAVVDNGDDKVEVEDGRWKREEKVGEEYECDLDKTPLKFGMVILLAFLLLIDAEDLYFLCGSRSKSTGSVTDLDLVKEKDHRAKYVPVAAPTKGKNDFHEYKPLADIHFAPRVSSDNDGGVKYPSHRSNSMTVWETKYHTIVQNMDDSVSVVAPMIPSCRGSTSGVVVTNHKMAVIDSFRASIDPHLTVDNDINNPVNSPFVPMRSLIPYTSPRPSHQVIPVPSVRNIHDWIPTYNWTLLLSDFSIVDHRLHSNVVTYPPDRRHLSVADRNNHIIGSSKEHKESVALTQYTFEEYVQQHENVLVTFYVPCERFEKKYIPLWSNLTKAIGNENLQVVTATVDCHSHPNICHEQGCFKFPTIRWFHNGKVLIDDYSDGRNAHKLFIFVKDVLLDLKIHYGPLRMNSLQPVQAPNLNEREDNDADTVGKDIDDRDQRLKSVAFMKKQRMPVLPSMTKPSPEVIETNYRNKNNDPQQHLTPCSNGKRKTGDDNINDYSCVARM
jgi:Thioredoxin